MDDSLYDKMIVHHLFTWLVVGCLIMIVALGCLVYLIKRWGDDDRFAFWTLLALLVGVIIGTIILVGNTVVESSYDLKNHAYIVCEGDFSVIDDAQTPSKGCTFILSDGKRLDSTLYVLYPGEYRGRIVYGEKNEKILEFQLFEGNM